MSKKHYIALASIIRERLLAICPDTVIVGHTGQTCQQTPCKELQLQTKMIAMDIASMCKHDKVTFDRDRFLTECGF